MAFTGSRTYNPDYSSTGSFIGAEDATGGVWMLDEEVDKLLANDNYLKGVISFTCPQITLVSGDFAVFGRITVPVGKTLEVVRGGIIQSAYGAGVTNLIMQVYNSSDVVELCNTKEAHEAFSSKTAIAGKNLYFRVYNNGTGSTYTVTGYATIMLY